jgi:hypothetical protein
VAGAGLGTLEGVESADLMPRANDRFGMIHVDTSQTTALLVAPRSVEAGLEKTARSRASVL